MPKRPRVAATAKPEAATRRAVEGREEPAEVAFREIDGQFRLDDLWLIAGSLCNLRCIHCYVGSSPENDSLEAIGVAEIDPFIREAVRFGVGRIYLTGGEPFLHPDILGLLAAALAAAPTTVLTNGTALLLPRLAALAEIERRMPARLAFRVSLDHVDPERHDAIRGKGRFVETARSVHRLVEIGFRPIITVSGEIFRGSAITDDGVRRAVPRALDLAPESVEVKILPTVIPMGSQLARLDESPAAVPVTAADLRRLKQRPEDLMCSNGRSLVKIGGRVRVYPCPLIYDVPAFDLGGSLAESFARKVPLTHVACGTYCCAARRGTCTDR